MLIFIRDLRTDQWWISEVRSKGGRSKMKIRGGGRELCEGTTTTVTSAEKKLLTFCPSPPPCNVDKKKTFIGHLSAFYHFLTLKGDP